MLSSRELSESASELLSIQHHLTSSMTIRTSFCPPLIFCMCNRTLATRSENLAKIKEKGVGQARANRKRIESITNAQILKGEAKKSYVNKHAMCNKSTARTGL